MKVLFLKGILVLFCALIVTYVGYSLFATKPISAAEPNKPLVFLTGVEVEEDRQTQVFSEIPKIHSESIEITSFVVKKQLTKKNNIFEGVTMDYSLRISAVVSFLLACAVASYAIETRDYYE